jgi:hypothetical protein
MDTSSGDIVNESRSTSPLPPVPIDTIHSFSVLRRRKPDGSGSRLIAIHEPQLYLRLGRNAPFSAFPWWLAQEIAHTHATDAILVGLEDAAWKAMHSDMHDLSTNNGLHKEFRNGGYSNNGITICHNILTLSSGRLVHIKEAGTERVVRLKGFRNAPDANLTLLFNDGSSKELPKDRLPFTNEAGLWFDLGELTSDWQLPDGWFPIPEHNLETSASRIPSYQPEGPDFSRALTQVIETMESKTSIGCQRNLSGQT